jgi:predicted RNase H-like nuclease (RuvC/YqgF family)
MTDTNKQRELTVAVTGAGSGLGQELALGFSAKGYRVFGTSLSANEALQFRWDVFYEKFMSDGNFRSAIIAVTSFHVSLEDLNNYLNETDYERRENQMRTLLDVTRRVLNIGQTQEELKNEIEYKRNEIEQMKKLNKEINEKWRGMPDYNRRSQEGVIQERSEREKEKENNEQIKQLEEQCGKMQRKASQEEGALRSNTERWNIVSLTLTGNIDALEAYKTEVNAIQYQLWEFLVKNSKNFSAITNWDDYRRITGVSSHKKIDVITQKNGS